MTFTHHDYGSSEEVVGFERTHFYESSGREGRDYLSRRYHQPEPNLPPRSRRQDPTRTIYRNGPYSALISPTTERSRDHHGRGWGYESPRYQTSSVSIPVSVTPQDIYPEERREPSCNIHSSSKKHSKSRSGSESCSTESSRSRSSSPSSRSSSCSSATSSPASDKSCSNHSQHGSLRTGGSVNASSINSSSPALHSEDRRSLAICVRNLPLRSSDTSLKDGLYHEYKKHGKVTWVKICGQGSERYAIVCFKKSDDVDKALQISHDKLFFGCKIDVAPYQGYDLDDNEFSSLVCRPFEADQDEFHPKATRTLFIGNLEKDITQQEIRKHFDQFGEILDIDIKKQGTTSSSYAFCQYTDIASVVRAIRSLDGEHLASTRIKLGFGKSLHTNCVWVDGISESVSEKHLNQHFSQFGPVSHVFIDRSRGQALISFEQITYAQQAVKEMRGVMLRGRKLQIDYASRECQDMFYEHLEKQNAQHSNYDNRTYEDIISVEESEARHKAVDIEECQSSGEEGNERRKCKHRRSEGDSSRPGTPLCDERPEPTEPRRPRERTQDPLSLPLPRFATQVLPPPSPPSSDDSQPSPPSPEWEERLRSLDEKYRKWSGSRTNPARPDPQSVRLRHRLLNLDPHDLQPSDIVKSLLAKRSVFDEDLKRLENFGEKYEPKEFVAGRVMRSPGSPVQGKGLQYPFPSHPDPSRPPGSAPTSTNTSPSFTKPLSQQTPALVKPKGEKTEITKNITSSLLVSSIKPKPFRRDSEPSEARRKSREEAPEVTKTLESAVKKEDTSECDKVKDAQVCERRKSTADKRRSSVDIKEPILLETMEKFKENCEKKELRRSSCDSNDSDSKPKDPRKQHLHESLDVSNNSELEKSKKLDSEFRRDTEPSCKNSSNIDIDRKKDIFGVNSEKDRRRKESTEHTPDNLKHNKKVPETNKCDSLAVKSDFDEIKSTDKKEESIPCVKSKESKKEQVCCSLDKERRRDSVDSESKRPPKLDEYPKQNKESKLFQPELKTTIIRKDSDSEFTCILRTEKDTVKPKEVEKKKNCENEILKEHSLFKKVFGFTDSLRNKDIKKESNPPKLEVVDNSKEKKEVVNETKSKKDNFDADGLKNKSSSRKSPEDVEPFRQKDTDKKKNCDISDRDRKKKDLVELRKDYSDISNEDYPPKEYDINYHNKRKVIERCLTKDTHNVNNDNDHANKVSKEHDRKKNYLNEEHKRNDEYDIESCKQKDNDIKNDIFNKEHKKKDYSHGDNNKNDKKINSESCYESEKLFETERKKEDNDRFKEIKNDVNTEQVKLKHSDKHSDRKKHQDFIDSSKFKDEKKKDDFHDRHRKKDSDFDSIKKEDASKNNEKRKDHFESNKFRDMDDAVRKRKDLESLEQTKPKETSERKKDILEKERRRDRELVDAKYKDDDKRKDADKERKRKEIESHEKINGDHIDLMFDPLEENDHKDSAKKEKKKEHRVNAWPASIGCKRRLSSQDSDLLDESKRSKQERRDSKDSSKSSGSSKKSDKHSKSFSKSLEDRIKEEKDFDKKKEDQDSVNFNEEKLKKQLKKEKKMEKKKEEKKFKLRVKENGTASESDLNSADEELKNLKRQHSIFDIVDDEPAYISMYDKVKARSTKNMQKQEEEKRQEKLKEKFSQLKQSRAKREEKKRSTSYDEDSDSERGGSGHRRSNKLMITSSDEDAGSESDMKHSNKNKKISFDFSEDDSILVTPKSKLIRSHNQEHDSKARKILSDTSEDDLLRHSTPKLKPKTTLDLEPKPRKIMSDTSEDDNLKSLSRIKSCRIQSDESENEIISYNVTKEHNSNQNLSNSVSDEIYSSRDFSNHNSLKIDQSSNLRSSSPEDFRRNSSEAADVPRKKKKQKKQKNFEDGDGSSKKHSSKKDKKKSHSKDDDENCKKSKKKKDRENKREEKMEDIFGPLSDDSDNKARTWHVNQVFSSDSEHEAIRKKEKRRREKKARELDEAGRALEANLMDHNDTYQVMEPVKNKKKKRKKSRDEKIKHHHSENSASLERLDNDRHNYMDSYLEYQSKSLHKNKHNMVNDHKLPEKEEDGYASEDFSKDNKFSDESQNRMEEEAIESILPQNSDGEEAGTKRPNSMASLLDSPPHIPYSHQNKKIDIPGFRGLGVDEDIHETAVKSISESSNNSIQISEPKFEPEKTEPTSNDEKSTPVISQEETEDAVAALLMDDTFIGTSEEFESYTEDTTKPDTPASEPDLQIDTDAEENYDIDMSKPPRTPDIPQSFYRQQIDTREGLEERILPLVCSSDTPAKDDLKVLEVPRTPGSTFERKADEDQPAEQIHPVKMNLDSPEKPNKDDKTRPESRDPENTEPKKIPFETKKEIPSIKVKEPPPLHHEKPKPYEKPAEKLTNDELFDNLVRGTIINDSFKKENKFGKILTEPVKTNTFTSNVLGSSKPETRQLVEPLVIKQNPPSVLSRNNKDISAVRNEIDIPSSYPSVVNKSVTPTPSHLPPLKPSTVDVKGEVDHLRVSSNQSRTLSPTPAVNQAGSNSPNMVRPQLHFQPTLHPIPSSLGLVRTSAIQSHTINTVTRPVAQVHHLAVIPSQQIRSPVSPHLIQQGISQKTELSNLQTPVNNPVIRHAVATAVPLQQVKSPATAIIVTQSNLQRPLQIVSQTSSIPPQNLKLIRSDQPNTPINIRVVRPVVSSHSLPLKQSIPVPHLQPVTTGDLRSIIPPLHEVKGPPTLVAIQDKPVIQHTQQAHISTPVNVIKNTPEVLKPSEDNRSVTENLIDKRQDPIDKTKEVQPVPQEEPLKQTIVEEAKESPLSNNPKSGLCDEENSSSNEGYLLDETKPLTAVIQDLTSKSLNKHHQSSPENHSAGQTNKNEPVRELLEENKINENKVDSSDKHSESVCIKSEQPDDVPCVTPKQDEKEEKIEVNVNEPKAILDEDHILEEKPDINHKVEIKEEIPDENKDILTADSIKKEEPEVIDENMTDVKESTELADEDKPLEIASSPAVEASEESAVGKSVIREPGGRRGRRKRGKVRASNPVRKTKNNPATPVKTSTDVYEFRDDSEEERPRLILTIKSPPDSSKPIKIKSTPTTRKSRRLQEKDAPGATKTVVKEVIEGTRGRGRGRRATRSTQPTPTLTVAVNPEPRKSPRRKQLSQSQSNNVPTIEEKPIKVESPPTPPPTPAASGPTTTTTVTTLAPSTPVISTAPKSPALTTVTTSAPKSPSSLTATVTTPTTVAATASRPVTPTVSTPSSPVSSVSVTTPAVPPTPPLSATPPASSTPPVLPVAPPSPKVTTPSPKVVMPSPKVATLSPKVATPPPKVATPPPKVVSPPPAPLPTPVKAKTPTPPPSTIISTPATTASPMDVSIPAAVMTPVPSSNNTPISAPTLIPPVLKVIPKPVLTSTAHPGQISQGSVPVTMTPNNMMQNRNSLEPTTLIDPVTGLLIPMQESEEGQYIPLHSDPNRLEGEPAKKRLRINPEVNRPTVVRQVILPNQVPTSTPSNQSHICQPPHQTHMPQHQSQMPQHQSQMPQHQSQMPQHQSHMPQHHQPMPLHQPPVSQHNQMSYHQQTHHMPLHQSGVAHHQSVSSHPSNQSQMTHQSMQHQQSAHTKPQMQSLATVTPVHVSHPPPLMPVSAPHHPQIPPGVHIQPVQHKPVSKPMPTMPQATITVSAPKIVVSKTEASHISMKPVYPAHMSDSHPSVVHSVPVTSSIHMSGVSSVVHTASGGHAIGIHGGVLQGRVHPAPAHSPALHPTPAHSPALHPTPAHSPVHPTPAHHHVRSLPHGLNPPAAHMQHAHAIHTPTHADPLRAVPSPAPGAPPGLPVACKPAPIPKPPHLIAQARPRASPSPAHVPPPKAHLHHPPITNIHDGSLVSNAGPLGASPPARIAHQQPGHPSQSTQRVVVKSQLVDRDRTVTVSVVPRDSLHNITSPQPQTQTRPVHPPGLPTLPAYEPSLGDVVQHYVSAHMQPAHYVHSQLMFQQWMGNTSNSGPTPTTPQPRSKEQQGTDSPPLELRRPTPTPPRPPYYETPPPAHSRPSQPRLHTPPHGSQVPPQADSLLMLLQRHPVMWQGLLALKNDQAAVQMHFVFGNAFVAQDSLPCNRDGSTPPLRIAQRMRLEQAQIEGVARKMQSDQEHCMLLALPCGRDHMDVLQQSNNLQSCFITYLQQKQAAGIVNIAVSGSQQPAYVIHIFPSCEFANESLARIAPDLMHRVADIAHLLIVIATV